MDKSLPVCQIAYQTGVGCYIRPATTVCRLSDILGFFIPARSLLFLIAVDMFVIFCNYYLFFCITEQCLFFPDNFSRVFIYGVKNISNVCVYRERY